MSYSNQTVVHAVDAIEHYLNIPWLLSQIVVIILIYLNYTYFKKREHLFCN